MTELQLEEAIHSLQKILDDDHQATLVDNDEVPGAETSGAARDCSNELIIGEEIERPTWVSIVYLMMSLWPDRAGDLDPLLELGNKLGTAASVPEDLRDGISHIIASLFPQGCTLVIPFWGVGNAIKDDFVIYRMAYPTPLPAVCSGLCISTRPVQSSTPGPHREVLSEKIAWTSLPPHKVLNRMRSMYVETPRAAARIAANCLAVVKRRNGSVSETSRGSSRLLSWIFAT